MAGQLDAKGLAAVFQRLVELALLLVHHGHVVVNVCSIREMVPQRGQLDAHGLHKRTHKHPRRRRTPHNARTHFAAMLDQ